MKKMEYKKPSKEDMGSYELTEDNKIVRNPQVRASDFLNNEIQFIDDPVRQSAWNELKKRWGEEIDFYDIIKNSELRAVFYNPDGFIDALNERQIIMSAERRMQINNIIDELQARKDKLVEIRLDYESVKDSIYDAKIKEEIEFAINDIEKYIDNGRKFLTQVVSS